MERPVKERTSRRILVRTQPRATHPGVEKTGENEYKVRVHAPPEAGKANEEVVKLLSKTFGVRKNSVRILSGHTSRMKTVLVEAKPI